MCSTSEQHNCISNLLLNALIFLQSLEHCLHEEQLDVLKSSTDHTYDCIAVSSFDNPPLLSGQNTHGGVALFWKHAFEDYITPLTNVHSDRIAGIKCDFDNGSPLYILSVYLPTSSQNDIDFLEYFNDLWALYDSLSVKGYVILMGNFNGDIGNSLCEKVHVSQTSAVPIVINLNQSKVPDCAKILKGGISYWV